MTHDTSRCAGPVEEALARDLADRRRYSLVDVGSFEPYGDLSNYVLAGVPPPMVRDEAATLAALRAAAPYLDDLLALGYVVAGGALAAAVTGGRIADVDIWRVAPDPGEVAAVLARHAPTRRFDGARHATWAFPAALGWPQAQLIRVDYGVGDCLAEFDIALAKMACCLVVAPDAEPARRAAVVLSADAARALATGVCPLDGSKASATYPRRVARYSRLVAFAFPRRDAAECAAADLGIYQVGGRIVVRARARTEAECRHHGHAPGGCLCFGGCECVGDRTCGRAETDVSGYPPFQAMWWAIAAEERARRREERARSAYESRGLRYTFEGGDADWGIHEVALRALATGDPTFLVRHDGWERFDWVAGHASRDPDVLRMLGRDASAAALYDDRPEAERAAARLAAMPAPDLAALFARTPRRITYAIGV